MPKSRPPRSGSGPAVKPDLRVCADLADLSRRAAEAAVGTINDAVRTAGTCSIVLSGGSTPRTLYQPAGIRVSSPDPVGERAGLLGR